VSKSKRTNRKVLRELRKAKADLAALIAYEKECNYILSEYSLEWTTDITAILKLFDRATKEEKIENNLQKEVFEASGKTQEKDEDIQEVDHSQSPGWVKKAFRKLALKTHPDKVANDLNAQHLIDVYSRANAAIEEKDYDLFLQICSEVNVSCELDPEIELEINLHRQENIRNCLKGIEHSLPWVWGESYGNLQIRKRLVLSILPHYGINEVEESKIEDILEKIHSS